MRPSPSMIEDAVGGGVEDRLQLMDAIDEAIVGNGRRGLGAATAAGGSDGARTRDSIIAVLPDHGTAWSRASIATCVPSRRSGIEPAGIGGGMAVAMGILGEDRGGAAGGEKSVEVAVAEEIEERAVGVERAAVAIDGDADRQPVEDRGVRAAPRHGLGGLGDRFGRRSFHDAGAERLGDAAEGVLLVAGEPARQDAGGRRGDMDDVGAGRLRRDARPGPAIGRGRRRRHGRSGRRRALDTFAGDVVEVIAGVGCGGRRRLGHRRRRRGGLGRRLGDDGGRRRGAAVVAPDHAEPAVAAEGAVAAKFRDAVEVDRHGLRRPGLRPPDGDAAEAGDRPERRGEWAHPRRGQGARRAPSRSRRTSAHWRRRPHRRARTRRR